MNFTSASASIGWSKPTPLSFFMNAINSLRPGLSSPSLERTNIQYLVEECEDYRSIRMLKSFLLIFILFIVVDHVELYWVADSVYLVFGPTIVADAPMPVCLYKPVLDSGWKRAGTYGMSCRVLRVVMENCRSRF